MAGEGGALRPRVKGKQPTEDEELSGARPGGRVLQSHSPPTRPSSSVSQALCAGLNPFLEVPAQARARGLHAEA